MEIEDPSLSAGLHLAAITSPRIYRTALAPLSKSNPPDIILIPIFQMWDQDCIHVWVWGRTRTVTQGWSVVIDH